MKEFEDELSPVEREAFDALVKEKQPPDVLERRIVEALRESGLIRSPSAGWRHRSIRIGWAFSASLALFTLGAVAGAWWGSSTPVNRNLPEFMLVLRTSSQELPTRSSEEVLKRVQEYNAWAKKIQQEGLLVSGEKLKDEARFLNVINGRQIVSATQADTKEGIAGYFLIRARDYQQAVTIAENCPHLKYGGVIEIRQIDDGEESN